MKRDSNTDVFLEYCEIFKHNYFEEKSAKGCSCTSNRKDSMDICGLILIRNIMWDGFC